jgi:para-aminobenzoate synthetase component I
LRGAVQNAVDDPVGATEEKQRDHRSAGQLVSNLTREAYLGRVARVKEYIAAGDVYQVNFSQRFEATVADEPYAIYRRLRALSPAPFGAYLDAGKFQILSSSPELFLRLDRQGRALTRPIKGTRPRGRNEIEDQHLAAELSGSEKDHAELLMIVDLERNDLGRVCRYGSIRVEERYRLEAHPTVFHLVATISGQLAGDKDVFDCLRSLLPGGSITGAPKIRAMQIIDELEPCRRHVYTGSLGYLGFDGTCDLNIAIRTILCREGLARFHVGGGIVADSDPQGEYQETLTKGRAMRAALLGEDRT